MRKTIAFLLTAALLVAVPGLASAKCNKGKFLEMDGPTKVELGKSYTYSVESKGQIDSYRWKVMGGELLHEWQKENSYIAEVRWKAMNAANPPYIEIAGEDDCRMERSSRLQIEEIFGSRGQAAPANKTFALDANGGKGTPYLNSIQGQNENLLWKFQKYNDKYVRIIPKVNQNAALDANGGTDTPYLNPHIQENDNLLWQLKKYGDYHMIVPMLNENAALDANGGEGQLYIHKAANSENMNHLWLLQKHGEYYRIISRIGKTQ